MIVSIPVDLFNDSELLKLEARGEGREGALCQRRVDERAVRRQSPVAHGDLESRTGLAVSQFLTEHARPSSIPNVRTSPARMVLRLLGDFGWMSQVVPKLLQYRHSIRPAAQKEDKNSHKEREMQAALAVMLHGLGNAGALASEGYRLQ